MATMMIVLKLEDDGFLVDVGCWRFRNLMVEYYDGVAMNMMLDMVRLVQQGWWWKE